MLGVRDNDGGSPLGQAEGVLGLVVGGGPGDLDDFDSILKD